MFAYPLRTAALTVAAAVGLSACTTPYGNGYSGVSVGIGSSGYYDPYYGGYGYGYGYPHYGYSRFGYGFDPYWGWHDGFYYPGTGFYVYDVYRRPHRWTDRHRRYWTVRRERALATSTTSRPVAIRDNWDDFKRDRVQVRSNRVERQTSRPIRVERRNRPVTVERTSRPARVERSGSPAKVDRSTARAERKSAREQRRSEIRAERTSRAKGHDREGTRAE